MCLGSLLGPGLAVAARPSGQRGSPHLDAPDHPGGWSVDASVTIPAWDRHGLEQLVIERILAHVREPTSAPEVLPARLTSDGCTIDGDQESGQVEWPDMDQTAGAGDETWD